MPYALVGAQLLKCCRKINDFLTLTLFTTFPECYHELRRVREHPAPSQIAVRKPRRCRTSSEEKIGAGRDCTVASPAQENYDGRGRRSPHARRQGLRQPPAEAAEP